MCSLKIMYVLYVTLKVECIFRFGVFYGYVNGYVWTPRRVAASILSFLCIHLFVSCWFCFCRFNFVLALVFRRDIKCLAPSKSFKVSLFCALQINKQRNVKRITLMPPHYNVKCCMNIIIFTVWRACFYFEAHTEWKREAASFTLKSVVASSLSTVGEREGGR